MQEQTLDLIKQLAVKFNTTVEQLWTVMLKQAYIYAVAETLLLIFAIVIALGAAAIINMTIAAKEKADWQNGTPYMWKIALFSFITVCAVISICVSCSNLGLIISGYINPEYWVIHYIKTK